MEYIEDSNREVDEPNREVPQTTSSQSGKALSEEVKKVFTHKDDKWVKFDDVEPMSVKEFKKEYGEQCTFPEFPEDPSITDTRTYAYNVGRTLKFRVKMTAILDRGKAFNTIELLTSVAVEFFTEFMKVMRPPNASYWWDIFREAGTRNWRNIAIRVSSEVYLCLDHYDVIIVYPNDYEPSKDSLVHGLLRFAKAHKRPDYAYGNIHVVYQTPNGFEKFAFKPKSQGIDLEENYNDDFKETSEDIITKLNNKDKTGLIILNGVPGTGKCVTRESEITVRNKKTGKIEQIQIADLM